MKKIKKFICGALAAAGIFSGMTALAQEDTVSVYVDNYRIVFDQNPVIIDGSTLVPVRAVFENAGAQVSWDQDSQTATLVKGKYTVTITLNDTVLYKNGEAVPLNTPAAMINDRILIPVRAIGEAMDFDIKWDGFHMAVYISTDGKEYRPYAARRSAFRDLPDEAVFFKDESFENKEIDLDGDGIFETVSFEKKYDHVMRDEPAIVINGRDLTLDFESFSSTYSFAVIDVNSNDTTREVIITENGDTLTAHLFSYKNGRLIPIKKGSREAAISYAEKLLFDSRGYIISDLEGICFTDIMVTGSIYLLENNSVVQYKASNAVDIVPRVLIHTYDDNMIYNYIETNEFVKNSYKDSSTGTISASELDRFELLDMNIDESNPKYFEFFIKLQDGRHMVLTPYSV